MRIWLDDLRSMPDRFDIHAITAGECIALLESGQVTHISFDHDLGESETGYTVACWIERHTQDIPFLTWEVHSANPVGAKFIKMAMLSAERQWG